MRMIPKASRPCLYLPLQKVYNPIMPGRKRYTRKVVARETLARLRREFVAQAGPQVSLLVELMENLPNVSCTIKNAEGRILYTNRYNASVSGWSSVDDMLGYTSEELYPPDQAAVYAGRDREVFETGKPIVDRIYGFVADRSSDLNCVTVRPIDGLDGTRIGTVTVYYRAQNKMKAANWYDPIRKSIAYLNEHVSENVSVERLAAISHYSVAQFRKLFEQLTQMTPSEYVIRTRVNKARTLLATTDRRISDIAAETGFCDHSHFIKTFVRLVGKTPNRYRQEQLGRA